MSKTKITRRKQWILIVLLSPFLLFLLLLIALRWYFPDSQVKKILIRETYRATGRVIEIDTLQVNLFGGIRVQGMRIGFTPEENMPGYLLEAENASFSYSLFPLLRKKVMITGVDIEKPQCHIVVRPSPQSDTLQIPVEIPLTIPFNVQLDRFQMQDARVSVSLLQEKNIEVGLEGLDLQLRNLFIPQRFWEDRNRIQLKAQLDLENSQLQIETDETDFHFVPTMKINFSCDKNMEWLIQGQAGLDSPEANQSILSFELNLQGKGPGDEIQILTCKVQTGNQPTLAVHGTLSNLIHQPTFNFQYRGDVLELEQLKRELEINLDALDLLEPVVRQSQLKGTLKIGEGTIKGKPDSVFVSALTSFSDLELENDSLGIHVGRGDGQLAFSALWTQQHGLVSGDLDAQIHVDSLVYFVLHDTVLGASNIQIRASSSLDSAFFPERGKLDVKMDRIAESPLHLRFDWRSASLDNQILAGRFDGALQARSIQLHALPQMPEGLEGNVFVNMTLQGLRLDSMGVDLNMRTSPVRYLLEGHEEKLPAVHLDASGTVGFDPRQKIILFDSGFMQVDSLVSASFASHVNLDSMIARFKVDSCIINNTPLQYWVPLKIKDQIGPFVVQGQEEVSLQSEINLNRPQDITVRAECHFRNLGYQQLWQDLTFIGGHGLFAVSGPINNLSYQGTFDLDGATIGNVRAKPFQNNHLSIQGNVVDQTLVQLSEGHLMVPSVGVNGQFNGQIVLTVIPAINVDGRMTLSAYDSIEVVDDLWLKGGGLIQVHGENSDADSIVNIDGYLKLDHLSLAHALGLTIENMEATFPFAADFNFVNGKLVSDTRWQPLADATIEINPSLYRLYYKDLGRIQIGKASFDPFYASGFYADLRIDKGWIDIPQISVHLLDGNLGGSAYLNLADGDLSKMTYGLQMQGARINSAALQVNRSKEGENKDTELNATFDFKGKGLDIKKTIDLDGAFHITQIGPNFAGTLLQQLDPKGVDRNIRLTRRLLSMGYKPKLFSFELRHGYVYPSLKLDQPWFSPIRIQDEFSYGRLPLEFFLKNPSFSK